MTMVVRRRTLLVATVAIGASLLAVAYLWRFATAGGALLLGVGAVLALIGVLHSVAWFNARAPLLVADSTGLRVRLGGGWTGVRWDEVERVSVSPRGRLGDGHVAVSPLDEAALLAGAGRRSRLAAAWNRRWYGAALAVPYGLATRVSVDDVLGELSQLADGRAPVVAPGAAEAEPEPTVGVPAPTGVVTKPAQPASGALGLASAPVVVPAESPRSRRLPLLEPSAAPAALAALDTGRALPFSRVVSALTSRPARRDEVSTAMHRRTTDGMLALSSPAEEVHTDELPEIAELRRRDVSTGPSSDDSDASNVALIIDATTDLSARAMRRVRSAPALAVAQSETDRDEARSDGSDGSDAADSGEPPMIGAQLRQARENLGLSLDDLADRTRIRPFVLECLEVDDFSPCGGDFYARGHLRMLARVLGLASEPLISTYDDKFATSPVSTRAVFDVELATGTTGMIRGGPAGANWGGLIAAVLVLLLVWGVARYFADRPSPVAAQPAATSNAAGLGSPGVGNELVPDPPSAHVKVTASGGDSRVVVHDSSGKVVFAEMLRDGHSAKVSGVSPLRVSAADAGVITLRVKGQQLGRIGHRGEHGTRKIAASAAAD